MDFNLIAWAIGVAFITYWVVWLAAVVGRFFWLITVVARRERLGRVKELDQRAKLAQQDSFWERNRARLTPDHMHWKR